MLEPHCSPVCRSVHRLLTSMHPGGQLVARQLFIQNVLASPMGQVLQCLAFAGLQFGRTRQHDADRRIRAITSDELDGRREVRIVGTEQYLFALPGGCIAVRMQCELNVCLFFSENPNFNAIVSIQGFSDRVSWNPLLRESESAVDDLHAACSQGTMIGILRNYAFLASSRISRLDVRGEQLDCDEFAGGISVSGESMPTDPEGRAT